MLVPILSIVEVFDLVFTLAFQQGGRGGLGPIGLQGEILRRVAGKDFQFVNAGCPTIGGQNIHPDKLCLGWREAKCVWLRRLDASSNVDRGWIIGLRFSW